ncbi:putative transcription initiation protein spt5 [Phaeomoniella chlamydospora]|uniref:Transcription elongation factor SPT5 n=1 Tax=Phaeomoniella chlamydospora TaxID=158046 RepID=A0A0G2EB20_PHACM|nr:putative transcription initiation protein spt5 [Phaeomoniella chlamydospora]
MADFLNQRFDSDEEEDDDDFNPAPADGSDDENANEESAKQRRSPPPRKSRPASEDGDDDADDTRRDSSRRRTDDGEDDNALGANEEDDDEADDGPGQTRDDDDGLDEEEDDEDEEDEDEAVTGRPRKRRRRGGLNQFFEEEAEVDEEDEDEAEEDELGAEFVADTHPDDLDEDGVADRDDRRHRELDRQRELEQSLDAEKQAEMLRERYGRRTATATNAIAVPKRLLLPSVDDPSIWGIQCRPGKEREVVFNIMKKFQERLNSRNPMRIFSAFERGGPMAGYVYIEARKKADIDDAIEGIMNIYVRGKTVLVPVKEMPDLLRVTKTKQLEPGGWVRIKRGKYTGDLAQIEEVETNGLDVTVRLVPRLDYGLNEDVNAPVNGTLPGDLAKRKRFGAIGANAAASRPPQRLFSENEAHKKHRKHLVHPSSLRGKQWTYFNDTYVDGFLIKDMKINHLITENVNPKLDEVSMFARQNVDGSDDLDLESLAQSLKNSTAEDSYLPGDHVEVYEGEQRGITGKVASVRASIVTIQVTEGDLAGQTVDVPTKGLRKRFREGDHVKVIGGSRYRDELGMVVRIKDDRVTVLTDVSMQEITVFSKDLREAADSGVDGRLGKYDVQDLVQLDPAMVACIIKVDRESMRVLDQNGSVRSILPSHVTNKIEPRRDAVAVDKNGSEIKSGDTVREVGGEGKTGTILHIHRAFLFCHNRTQTENSGLFVARSTNVATVAAKGGRGAQGIDYTKLNPALKMNGIGGNGAMPPPRTMGRDRTIGKTVTIRKGPYKGLMGIVKDASESTARVELHSKSKIITVEKDLLSIKDPLTGQSVDNGRFGGRSNGGMGRTPYGGVTPSRVPEWNGGSRTPLAAGDGGRTPAWGAAGGRTPAWGGGGTNGSSTSSRTPAWKPSGSQTSYGGASGGMTAYGGSSGGSDLGGGRTPVWTSSARTPYGGDHGFSGSGSSNSGFDTFASGSRTPYGGTGASGGRTPAWGATPKPYDAPTPAAHNDYSTPYASAPTPAASAATPRFAADAPTPRAYDNSAPTPAATGAPTPGPSGYGMDAPTPAGDGGGPRYIDSDEE